MRVAIFLLSWFICVHSKLTRSGNLGQLLQHHIPIMSDFSSFMIEPKFGIYDTVPYHHCVYGALYS